MTSDEQLKLWVKGISVHNDTSGECCPDFSCCQPALLAEQDVRETFYNRPETRMDFLMMFLGKAVALMTDKSVHVAGGPYEEQ